MKILHIWKRIDHHSAHSGYDQLSRYLPCTHYRGGKIFHFLYSKNPEKFGWIKTINPEWYSFEYFCLEMELLARIHLVSGTIFHMLYGENQYRYLGYAPLRRSNRVVASFHQPPDIFPRSIPKPRRLAWADALVVVGSSQVDFFRRITRRDNVHVVPHGVDADYFTPGPPPDGSAPLRCISVGWWLRDVETIHKVIELTNRAPGPKVEYHIVTFSCYHDFYRDLPNVHLHSGVPDEELRELYRQSDLLLLPLKDCTANNAVLEAMACGLPVYTSRTGSVLDYVGEDNAVIAPPRDPQFLADALLAAAADRSRLGPMREASRRRGERFAWPRVAEEMMACYRRIE